MTDMKRITVSLTDKLDEEILALKNTEPFKKASYSEIIRFLLYHGIEAERAKKGQRKDKERTAR